MPLKVYAAMGGLDTNLGLSSTRSFIPQTIIETPEVQQTKKVEERRGIALPGDDTNGKE
ncbi:MAG: hypothetical protein ACJAS3_001547 [Roseivirga sp.]|jgi:hypothetical protein